VSLHRQHGDLIQNVHITEVQTPTQIRCHANKLFVCDSDHKCIIIYHLTDEEIHFIGKLAAPETCVSGSASFLDCSGIATDRYGNLLIADMALDRVHCLSPRGHMSSIVGRGKPMLRPMCVATNCEGLMAISQHGVFPLEEEMPTQHEVVIYKLLQADV
jgi:sugar lactone lactonase YvrE